MISVVVMHGVYIYVVECVFVVNIVVSVVLLSSMCCNAVMNHMVIVWAFIRNEADAGDCDVERQMWSTSW